MHSSTRNIVAAPVVAFGSEKAMCDRLEAHLALFCKEVLRFEMKRYKREAHFGLRRFGANKPKVDFAVRDAKDRMILIECKNPVQAFAEMSRAISQMLCYSTLADDAGTSVHRLVLVTSKTLPVVQQTIMKYELPVEVVLLDASGRAATWSREWEQQSAA